jgi:hypothetical protein
MKTIKLVCTTSLFASLILTNSVVQAALLDQSTTASSEFEQVYQNGTGMNLTVEGAGVNRVVNLSMYSYTYGVGSTYWSGEIPPDAIIDKGVAGLTVNLDTCGLAARVSYGENACGLVDVTFSKEAYLWKTNGVTRYSYGDILYQIIGGISTFSAAAQGTIRGVAIDTTTAYEGKYTDVSITVSTAN